LERHALGVATPNVYDTPSILHVSGRCLRCDKNRAHIYCERAVKVGELDLSERPKHRHTGAVDKDLNAAQVSHSAIDGTNDRFRIRTVGLNGNGPNPRRLCGLRYFVGPVRRAGIGERNVCAILGKPLHNGSPDPPTASSYEGTLIGKWFVHCEDDSRARTDWKAKMFGEYLRFLETIPPKFRLFQPVDVRFGMDLHPPAKQVKVVANANQVCNCFPLGFFEATPVFAAIGFTSAFVF
jgi:hypothetical protein